LIMKEGYPTNQNLETNRLEPSHKKSIPKRLLYKPRHFEHSPPATSVHHQLLQFTTSYFSFLLATSVYHSLLQCTLYSLLQIITTSAQLQGFTPRVQEDHLLRPNYHQPVSRNIYISSQSAKYPRIW